MEKTQNKLNMRLESRKFPINLQDREFNIPTSQILPKKAALYACPVLA